MMKTSKLVLGLTKHTDASLESRANAILAAITGNANFPEPQPSLEVFGTTIKNFSDAVAAAQTRDRVKVAAKNNLRLSLQLAIANLANYVSYVAQGDRVIQISSGFAVNATSNTPVQLGNPENFSVQLGRNSGEVVVSVNNVAGAKTYTYFYAPMPVPDNGWLHTPYTASSFVITGLEPGKQYSFRIGINGARGQKVYTDIITRLVV